MNKPKFRALSKKSNEWVYGVPIPNGLSKRVFMICLTLDAKIAYPLEQLHDFCVEVIPETIGQYTGLKDKNGVEIYEGDVIASQNKNRKNWHISHHEIVWHDAGFMGKQICSSSFIGIDHWTRGKNGYVVIGNIHENPELLNEVE